MNATNLRTHAQHALMASDPATKAKLASQLYQQARVLTDQQVTEPPSITIERVLDPGRPENPKLVAPRDLPRRITHTQAGRNVMAHAFAHIEFNAINIALDAVYRFNDMPGDFYRDWLRVAAEEGRHYQMLADYLAEHDSHYGLYPAHDSLWESVCRTDHDVLIRMALVPRVLEARGLDVTPAIAQKLRSNHDNQLADILGTIYDEEIGHVEIGTRWFRYCCQARDLDARITFRNLLNEYMSGRIRGPYDEPGRLAAGFTKEELDDLKLMEAETLARLEIPITN
ncbi:MAG TPA: ferritin-like domain-containing protein [Halothiobacillus sp.]|nr:ferritin-like domain-containing protein [Halothiobacillus sp.]